ncbi:MAG: NAD(P)-binding domain-containing protein [DPANN group archaeon]|nr:NAD(P)-binding domain-containing protein [DPANN group archaeon]
MKITILGSGAMASAISVPLSRNGHAVNIWGTEFDKAMINALKAGQPHPTLKTPIKGNFFYENELEAALKDSDIVVFAVISSGLRSIAQKAKPFLTNQIVVNVAKGFDNGQTMIEVLEQELPNLPKVAIAGPSNAKDVSQELRTSVVFASKTKEVLKSCKKIFQTKSYKIETSNDIGGAELCSALKNVYAILVHSAKTDNERSALYVTALAEMAKFVKACGGKTKTVYGLAGAGDLFLAQWGRNGMLGQLIASGKKPSEALAELKGKNITVEGYAATKAAFELAKSKNLNLPLLEATYAMLYEDKEFGF